MGKWILGSFLSLLLSNHALANELKMTQMSIEQVVRQALNSELEQLAAAHHWDHYEARLVILVPESAKHLNRCLSPLITSSRDHQTLPVGNLKRSVSCEDGSNDWRINVSIRATLSLPVAVASTTLNRHDSIDSRSIRLETRTLSRATSFVTDLSTLQGKQVTRRMRTGQIIDSKFVSSPPLVEKGNEVVIIAERDGFNATTKGIALETGASGEQIKVQNSQSKKVIRAVVSGLNQVHTQF
ncbi:flagellar basal body P-ring formation chaperone FlgA [Vibrio maritimus]|uniref:flagellar basal body P-ring formation chaperone FlgA n=1 Tax=Vibrio maritimus TaxID=990268 RepID=UPI0037369261